MARPFVKLQLRLPWASSKAPAPESTRDLPCDKNMTAWCREITANLNLLKLSEKISVTWNSRMRTTVGRAYWPDCRIELNPRLREFSEEETQRTLKHELAHLVAYARSGRRKIAPHGAEWRTACIDLGIPGESVRHTLPLSPRKMLRKYAYTCPACSALIHRVRPIKRPSACHNCCRRHNGGRYHQRYRLIESILTDL